MKISEIFLVNLKRRMCRVRQIRARKNNRGCMLPNDRENEGLTLETSALQSGRSLRWSISLSFLFKYMQRFVLDICANLLKTYRFLPIANMSKFNAKVSVNYHK